MLELYSDSNNKVFDFKLDIEGAKPDELEVRMIATFEKHNRNYIFWANLSEDNVFRVEVPPLSEIENETFGKLKLEVISEDMIFNTWDSAFQIKSKKNVKVNEVNSFEQKQNNKPIISVNKVEESNQEDITNEEKIEEDIQDDTSATDSITTMQKEIDKHLEEELVEEKTKVEEKVEEPKKKFKITLKESTQTDTIATEEIVKDSKQPTKNIIKKKKITRQVENIKSTKKIKPVENLFTKRLRTLSKPNNMLEHKKNNKKSAIKDIVKFKDFFK